MLPRAHQRKATGPRYYRVPSFWGLIATFIVVLLLIVFLLKLG